MLLSVWSAGGRRLAVAALGLLLASLVAWVVLSVGAGSGLSVVQGRLPSFPALFLARSRGAVDADADGISDAREYQAAVHFAPVVVHDRAERAFPTDVDQFLQRTTLWFYDDACSPDLIVPVGRVSQARLENAFEPTCGSVDSVNSYGTRSERKQHTFFLADLAPEDRTGGGDPENWPTYVHVYRNDRHGLTLQYWRFYAYNDRFPYHGGDWESLHVVLDARGSVTEVVLIGHVDIAVLPPEAFQWDSTDGGLHPIVGVQRGSHTTITDVPSGGPRHLSWRSPLINVGEKTKPLNGQLFLQYSGLWGSPGVFYQSSGYWGPAFNETDLADDGFVVAWCRGMVDENRELNGTRECYASRHSR